MLERIEPSVDKLVEHVVSHSDYKAPTTPKIVAEPHGEKVGE